MSATQFNQERLLQVLLAPQISEKATMIAEHSNQVVFIVTPDATKPEIKRAVEELFKVKVVNLSTMHVRGKLRRQRTHQAGQAPSWKKAIVTLKKGDKIVLT